MGLSLVRLNIPTTNYFNNAPEKYQLNHCDVNITHFTRVEGFLAGSLLLRMSCISLMCLSLLNLGLEL